MATESPNHLDRRIKELELEKREEELRQLKANARVRWITPAAMAALLPIIAGFGLWVAGEIKQYNEGYRALMEKDELEQEKDSLQKQKDSLNIEIATLLQLKEHYEQQAKQLSLDVEAKQEIMDKTYLRAVFLGSETVYSLDHINGIEPGPDQKALDAIKADVRALPSETAARMEKLMARYELMGAIIDTSRDSVLSFQKAVNLIPASDWARRLEPMPTGSVIPGRSIMFSGAVDGKRYYDITEARFLTKEEAEHVR